MSWTPRGRVLRRFVAEAVVLLGPTSLDALARRARSRPELAPLTEAEIARRIGNLGFVAVEDGVVRPHVKGRASSVWRRTRQRVERRTNERWGVDLLRRNPGGLTFGELSRLATEAGLSAKNVRTVLFHSAGVDCIPGYYRLLGDTTPFPLGRGRTRRDPEEGVAALPDGRWRLAKRVRPRFFVERHFTLATRERLLPPGLFAATTGGQVLIAPDRVALHGFDLQAAGWQPGDLVDLDFDLERRTVSIERREPLDLFLLLAA